MLERYLHECIVPTSFRDAHVQGLQRFNETSESPVLNNRIEITAMRSDGSEFPVELAIVVSQAGKSPVFTAYIRDLTEQKKAEIKRDNLQEQLMTTSRRAGMAEVATGGVAQRGQCTQQRQCVDQSDGRQTT